MSNQCLACGDELPAGARFCISCGSPATAAATGPTQRLSSPEAEAAFNAFAAALNAEGYHLGRDRLLELAEGYEWAIVAYPERVFIVPYLIGEYRAGRR